MYGMELYHYGRKGMKWYQRIYSSAKETAGKATAKQVGTASKSVSTMLSSTQSQVSSFQDIRNKNRADKIRRSEKVQKATNKELQEAINRMNLERTYSSMMASPNRATGAEYVNVALSTLGTLSTVSLAGLGLYKLYKDIK